MERTLNWQKNFIEFDRDATKAASLGQVHKATLHNKKVVACKLQYPDMESAVTADLSQLKLIFSIYQNHTAIDLLTSSHHSKSSDDIYKKPFCFGAVLLNNKTNKIIQVYSDKTILATGGLGQIYLHSTNPPESQGDGIAMAWRAGDVLVTGTPGGVGFKRNPPIFMKPGDKVEVEITDIGVLSNTIKDEII